MKNTDLQIQKNIKAMREHMRATGRPHKTIKAYTSMCQRYLYWQIDHWTEIKDATPEKRMGSFISSLANDKKNPISFNTQKSYWSAVLYFYRDFKGVKIGKVESVKAKNPNHIFSLLTIEQAKCLWDALPDTPQENYKLIAMLMFGTGMRIETELLRLRVKDVLFERKTIEIQEGKGGKSG